MTRFSTTGFVFLLLLAAACSRDQALITLDLPGGTRLTFQEGQRAALALTQDKTEGYFANITLTDMAIQLKKPVAEFPDREQAMAEYLAALEREVMSFTLDDINYLESVFRRVNRLIYRFSPEVLPSRIGLIKVRGNLLGGAAFFTRDGNIILGRELLTPAAESQLVDALIMSVFHLYSRQHADQRPQLYQLVGYQSLPVRLADIAMPADFREKLLLQPDAQDRHYTTSVAGIEAPYLLPLHTTAFHHFTMETTSGLHKTCSIYVLEQTDSGAFALQLAPDGSSTISFTDLRQVIRQADPAERTTFIHPEFALAWLFNLAVRGEEESTEAAAELTDMQEETFQELHAVLEQMASADG